MVRVIDCKVVLYIELGNIDREVGLGENKFSFGYVKLEMYISILYGGVE